MPRDMLDRNFLVVGASSGIGLAAARRIAEAGGRVVGVGRSAERIERAVAELPGNGHVAIAADAAEAEQLAPLLEHRDTVGRFSGAIVCAGAHALRPLAVLKAADIDAMMRANLITAMNVTSVFPKLALKEGASMVWLSSIAAHRGSPGFFAYAAAKGAMLSAARVAAAELAPRKIRVNTVVAGIVDTPLSEEWLSKIGAENRETIEASYPFGFGRPEDIAGAILFLLSDDAAWMTGAELLVDGGVSIK